MSNFLSAIKIKANKITSNRFYDGAAIFSLCVTALYFWVLFRNGQMTLRYDSAVERSIAAGDMIGYPNAHTLFINYVFGCILAFLYNVLPMWNWYTILLLFSMYFGLWAVLFRVNEIAGKDRFWRKAVYSLIVVFFFNFLFFKSLMSLYALECAAICGMCGLIYLLFADELRKRDVLIIVTLVTVGAGLRYSVIKELLPFFAIGVLLRWFVYKKKKNLLVVCAVSAVVLLSMKFIGANAYTGIYADEKEVNHYRAAIQDYNGLPGYEGHEEVYESLGMSEEDYELMKSCWGLSDFFNKETLEVLIEVNEEANSDLEQRKEQMFILIEQMFAKDYTGNFWLLEIFAFIGIVLLLAKKKDWMMLLGYAATFAVVAGELLYLAYNGRMPVRTTISPLLALIMVSVGYFVQNRGEWAEFLKEAKLLRAFALCVAVVCLLGTLNNTIEIKKTFDQNFSSNRARHLEMVKYFLNNQDNTYFCHGLSDYLDLYKPVHRNYTGYQGWISETVDWKTMMRGEYDNIWDAIAYRDDLRFLILDYQVEILQNYLNSHGYKSEAVYDLVTIGDNEYYIWRFETIE